MVGEDIHPPSYHRNDSGTRASYLYDGDDKTHGATAVSSTGEVHLNSHSRTRRGNTQRDTTTAKDECSCMEAVDKKGWSAQQRGSKLQGHKGEGGWN